jgi:hypothetical protein
VILAAYAQANDRGQLHVWVGMLGVGTAPAPNFRIDGAPVAAASGSMQKVQATGQDWYGRFLFQPPAAKPEYRIDVDAGGETVMFTTRLLPTDLPEQMEREFRVLLFSCYSKPEDNVDVEEILLRRLNLRPDLTIMAGDQVYLDLPVTPYPRTQSRLTADLRDKYVANWSSVAGGTRGIAEVLQLAPVVNVPDDHEFWNNYPYAQAQLANTWSKGDRDHWTTVAKEFFEAFQRGESTRNGATRLTVGPLKFLCIDMRSDRDDNAADLMPPPTWKELDQWVTDLQNTPGSVGVLCSGQSLLSKRANSALFNVGDAEMPNYSQFDRITQRLDDLASLGIPVVYLTGDVHWGRVSVAKLEGRSLLYEVISSPSTLIHVPVADPLKKLAQGVKRLFGGETSSWPLHSEADKVPDRFGPQGRFRPEALKASVVGNQVAMVGFRRKGTSLEFTVTYYGVSPDPGLNAPQRCGPYPLDRY